MQNVDYSSAASTDEKRKEQERCRGRESKLYSCQDGGVSDRLSAVEQSLETPGFLPPDPCVCRGPIEPIESDAHVQYSEPVLTHAVNTV